MEQIVQIKLEANSSAFLNCIFVSNFSVHCEISFVCCWKKNLSLKRLFPFKSHFAEKNLIKKDVCTNTLLLWLWFLKKKTSKNWHQILTFCRSEEYCGPTVYCIILLQFLKNSFLFLPSFSTENIGNWENNEDYLDNLDYKYI